MSENNRWDASNPDLQEIRDVLQSGGEGEGWKRQVPVSANSVVQPKLTAPYSAPFITDAPLEGTGNGADERAAFIAAFLETLPPESVAEFEAAARGIAESAIDARGPSWKMWRAGIAYIRSVLEGGNHA